MQQFLYDFTSSQIHLEKLFQLLHLLGFCLLHYLLSSDSKAMAKVSKLHTSFFKTKKNKLVFYIIFVKGNASRFGSAIQVLPSDMENTLTHILPQLLQLFFIIFILLWKNAIFYTGKMQFFIHCNFFCQEYKFNYLLTISLLCISREEKAKAILFTERKFNYPYVGI